LSTATEGFPFGAALQLTDQFGNLETEFSGNISLALDLNGQPGGSDLGGTASIRASGGVANFTNIVINDIGNPFTLIASGGGITSAPSSAINVVPPVLTPGNSVSATAGVAFPLTYTAETNTGAVDTAFNGVVKLTIHSGPSGAALQGTTTATASSGIATFSGVILDTAGSYDLRASSGNLTPGDTNVTVSAAAAGILVVQEPPSSVQAGAGFGLQVGAKDQFGPAAIDQLAVAGELAALARSRKR
jgi:hypothetical protein